tara:strand:- start:96 stop:350 length:255 start_codon:yes stop_codon:yes gene_type:complete
LATLFKTDNTVEAVKPKQGESFSLKELQGYVGGYIELVKLRDGTNLVVNEEGLMRRLPVNEEASHIANRVIVGDALLVHSGEVD